MNIIHRDKTGHLHITHLSPEAQKHIAIATQWLKVPVEIRNVTDGKTVAELDAHVIWVKANIGLTEEEHADILVKRANDEWIKNGADPKNRPEILDHEFVDFSIPLPSDRLYRNAWRYDNGIKIDLQLAKSIFMEKLRISRNKELDGMDVETMRAISLPSELKLIETKKQALRDLPASVDSSLTGINSIEELSSLDIDAMIKAVIS